MPGNERIFAIGDIHGCLAKLEKLAGMLDIRQDDTVVFLGDYIDRGPDPKSVVDFLVRFRDQCAGQVIFLKGNHEVMFIDYLQGRNRGLYLHYGGISTVESYLRDSGSFSVPENHKRFFSELSTCYETREYIFVHAGLRPGIPFARQTSEDMLWIRSEFVESDYDWGKRVIFGHTAFSLPLIQKNKIGIDTGAVYGRKLTCLVLPEVEMFFT